MKKLLLMVCAAMSLSSCGVTYKTLYSGKDNESFVIVLTEKNKFENISVAVDGVETPIYKVEKVNKLRKAQPVIITPGKHNIKILQNGNVLIEENIFIGLQETKKIVLK